MVVKEVFPSRMFIQDADFFLSRIQQQKKGKNKLVVLVSFTYIRKFYKIKNYFVFLHRYLYRKWFESINK